MAWGLSSLHRQVGKLQGASSLQDPQQLVSGEALSWFGPSSCFPTSVLRPAPGQTQQLKACPSETLCLARLEAGGLFAAVKAGQLLVLLLYRLGQSCPQELYCSLAPRGVLQRRQNSCGWDCRRGCRQGQRGGRLLSRRHRNCRRRSPTRSLGSGRQLPQLQNASQQSRAQSHQLGNSRFFRCPSHCLHFSMVHAAPRP